MSKLEMPEYNNCRQVKFEAGDENSDKPIFIEYHVARLMFCAATRNSFIKHAMRNNAEFDAYAQALDGFENIEAGKVILSNMMTISDHFNNDYNWHGKIYSKDGADILLMHDGFCAFAYAWDSESRVSEVNMDRLLAKPKLGDVPSDEDIDAMRAKLREMVKQNENNDPEHESDNFDM